MKTRRTIIVNTSPLFYLHKLECLECLAGLYGSVTVPEAVAAELEDRGRRPERAFLVSATTHGYT